MKTGIAILAGGKSLRMGQDKARLTLGGENFLSILANEFWCFEEKILCPGDMKGYELDGFVSVEDKYGGIGPISGLHAALEACKSETLLVVTCDVPLFSRQLGDHLAMQMKPGHQVAIPRTRDGGLHPLCGVYRKEVVHVLEEQIASSKFCLQAALDKVSVCTVELRNTRFPDTLLSNINTPLEYQALCDKYGGWKTTRMQTISSRKSS